MIKTVIADDHEIFRDGLKLILEKDDQIQVIGEARNGIELVELVKGVNPDVVITDIVMPEMDGIEATKSLLILNPDLGIITLSMLDEDTLVMEMLDAGALGYLVKNAEKFEVLDAVKSVYNKRPYFCNSISSRLVKMIGNNKKFNPYKDDKTIKFNNNELEIIRLICQELASKEIAPKLNLSIRTVEGYRRRIMEKIDVKTPAGIAIYALKNNLYKP